MAWLYLVLAGLFEIAWPLGLKWAQEPRKLLAGSAIAVACMSVSGLLLFFAQKEIAIGTAYAVWTGIGVGRNIFDWRQLPRRSRKPGPLLRCRTDHRGRHHAEAGALNQSQLPMLTASA